MYFPVADIELAPWAPLLIGFAVSVVSSPTGISGAFLILPICMNFLGFVSPAVSPTNYIFNVVASPAGLWRFHREKRLMWGMGFLIAVTSLPGILAGTVLRGTWLQEAADFKIFVALVLSALALNLARTIIRGGQAATRAENAFVHSHGAAAGLVVHSSGPRNIRFDFSGQAFVVPVHRLAAVSLAVGLVGGVYGLGGAAIIAPLLLSLFRLPIYVISGASLLAGWASSVFGLFSYICFWPWFSGQPPIMPDFALGLLFSLGGLVGIYCGASLQRFLPPRPLKILMLLLIATLAVQNFGLF
ncbi:MAG: sulfite exporter TauE/SafE family protein [Candidatus Adiutrix sp.]|jgi:uncharacterized membrane protein YfcA|nr:sulfite exporter TauE/SafE family protein [Candidatus Adiutrix sp.]